jgi:HlyD family secretion protein
MRQRFLIPFALLFLVLGIAGCQQDEIDDTPIDPNTIALDTGIGTVTAEGEIVPPSSIRLAFQTAGTVLEVAVLPGDSVSEGDILIRLDDSDQQIARLQAEVGLIQAQANIKTAEARVATAKAALEASTVGVDAAEAQLSLLKTGPTEEQIAFSESQVGAAEAGVSAANGQRSAVVEGATQAQILAAEAQIQAARAAVVPIEIQISQINVGSISVSDDQRNQINLQLAAAQANVAAAETALQELLAGARQADIVAVGGAVAAAQAQQEASQAQLNLVLAGTREEQIAIGQTGVDQAKNGVREAELSVNQAESGLVQAQTSVVEAEKAIEAIDSLIAKTILKASADGVIADITPEVGEVVLPGLPVVTLADFESWQVETTDLTELSVVNIAVGKPVEVTVDAFPGETLSGTIIDIASNSEIVLGDVTYKVTIDLTDTNDLDLRWGMTSFVRIDVE